jgi:hypothetical protein
MLEQITPPPHAPVPLEAAPIAKVTNGTLAGAIAIAVIYVLRTKFHIDLPQEVDDAFKVIVASSIPLFANYLASYFTPLRFRELK